MRIGRARNRNIRMERGGGEGAIIFEALKP